MLFSSDSSTFKSRFKNKLSDMLEPDELGSFILVLANSMQDSDLHKSLKGQLETTFKALKNNKNLKAAPDDITVFEALKKTGIGQYGAWQTRQINSWQCAYNPMRGLRPERSSKEVFEGLQRPFNRNAFHFSKPFLRPEILSDEVFEDTHLQVMYHKFPFIAYHLLIVIDAAPHISEMHSQYLDSNSHQLASNLAKMIQKTINGFGLSYNSLGAGASVNQLHIHGFIEQSLFSVEKETCSHNVGNRDYPIRVNRFTSTSQSWEFIEQLHQNNQPYNLLYRGNVCYVIQRKPQGEVRLPKWLPSVGWYEACGGFNLTDENYYQSLTADNIYAALSLLNVTA